MLSLTDREAEALAESIMEAKHSLHYCDVCGNLTDKELCGICSDASRDKTVICVVETPQDVMAMERIREYHGLYHVLHGAISPAEGIGPADINLKSLIERLQGDSDVEEVIIATSPKVEGDMTYYTLLDVLRKSGTGKVSTGSVLFFEIFFGLCKSFFDGQRFRSGHYFA